MNKEQVYDAQISPLMARIIAICEEHKIAMVASFHVPTENAPTLMCSTALVGGIYPAPPPLVIAGMAVRSDKNPMVMALADLFLRTKGGA